MIELLILYVLSEKEMTMYGVLKRVHEIFGSFSQPSFGAIKPALTRLEKTEKIRGRKAISDGGKQSGFYSITQKGLENLKKMISEPASKNPLQFHSTAYIKLACASYLPFQERADLFEQIKNLTLQHKFAAQKSLENSKKLDFYQRIILDNLTIEYKNLVSFIENLEKDLKNAGNSK